MAVDEELAPLQHPIADRNGFIKSNVWWLWFTRLSKKLVNVITGTGTSGTIPKWSGTNTLTDSVYTETQLRARLRDYDEEAYTEDTKENVTQVLYKRSSVTQLTEARTYNIYDHIATAVFTGDLTETWTYSYASNNFTVTGVVVT